MSRVVIRCPDVPSNDLDLASGVLKAHSAEEVPGIFTREPLCEGG